MALPSKSSDWRSVISKWTAVFYWNAKHFPISLFRSSTGRLFKQMTRLAMSPLNGVLVLEGSSRDLKPSGVRREALQGALITTSLILGIPVLRAFNPDETARLMVYTARQVRFAATGAIPRSGYRPKGKRKQQLHILQSLPGVGPARGQPACWPVSVVFGTC